MNIQTGTVTGREVKKNRDGENPVLLLQVVLSSDTDVQTVELMQGAGDQVSPENGSKVLVISNGPAYKIAIAVDDMTAIALEVGERAIAAVIDGGVKSSVHCKADGNLVFNNGADYAVQFAALKVGFDQLKKDLNGHFHGPAGTPPAGAIPPGMIPSTASIDGSKVDKVRMP